MNSIMICGNGIHKGCLAAALLLVSVLTTCAYASSYTSASYVQREHLVAQWDGIDNAGTGTHDPEATIWKDLAGNHDLSLTNSATWKNGDRLAISGVSAVGTGPMGAYKTIEVVYRMPVGLPHGRTLFTSGNSTTRQLVMFDHDIGISSDAQRGTIMYFSGESGVSHQCIERYPDDSLRFAAATFDDSSKTATEVFADGVLQTNPILKSNPWGNSGGFAMIGGMNKGDTSYMWHGEVLSIRLYSEKLTAEQIAANHAIDLARFGRRTPTSADYVSDGLIAHWDGIDNAGTGVHDPTATVWKDIANPVNGYDLDLTVNGSWSSEGNALVVNGPSAKSTIAGPAYKTIEVVFKRADDTGRILFATGDKKRYVVQNKTSSGTTLVQFDGETNGKTRGTKVVKLPDRDTGVCFLSVRYDDVDNVMDILESADPCATSMYTNDWPSADGVLMIGDRNSNGGNYSWRGELYAIRLYNRRLTRAEMSRNHRIDCQRFLTSSSYISTNLVAHWDGINNAGTGQHDPTAPEWKNLVSGGLDLKVATGLWTDSSLMCMGTTVPAATNSSTLAYISLECVFSNARSTNTASVVFSGGNQGGANRYLLLHSSYSQWEDTHRAMGFTSAITGRHSLTGVRSGAAAYLDGEATVYEAKDNSWGMRDGVAVGARLDSASNKYPFRGDVFSIRAYSTALTPANVAYNRKVDRWRFGLSARSFEWDAGSGYFCTNGNWTVAGSATQAVPGSSDAVSLPDGEYTVTLDDEWCVESLSVGAGVMLKIVLPAVRRGTLPPPPLTVANGIAADAASGFDLDSTLFDAGHYGESATLIECGEDSSAALRAMADSVNARLSCGKVAVEDGKRLVYTLPPQGMSIIFR